jgi:predicted amidohydrolase YtcJ
MHGVGNAQALGASRRVHVLGAAYLLGQDDKKGSIVTGKLADFTVLDRNPLDVASPDALKDIKVLGTVMGGKAFPAGAAAAGR